MIAYFEMFPMQVIRWRIHVLYSVLQLPLSAQTIGYASVHIYLV